MKKVLLFAIAALVCGNMGAKSPFSITSGSVSCFKEAETAVFVIDHETATFQHGNTLAEESGDVWGERLSLMNDGFVRGFNEVTSKKKGLQTSLQADNAKYTITLHISNIDRKVCPTLTWADQALKVDGVIDVVDNASGETVCSINVDGFMLGKGTTKISTRITQCFEGLGSKTAKLAK